MRDSVAVILCFLKVSGFGAPECYNIAFRFAQHFFLFTSVTDVCFINRKFPFCDAISICSYFHFELSCITVIFPNVTLKNMSEQENQILASLMYVHQYPHKRGSVTTPTAGVGWKSHISEGQKK
jgi:hypothetical protein